MSVCPGDHSDGEKTTQNALEGNQKSTIRSLRPRYLNLRTNQVYGHDGGVTRKGARQRGAETNGTSIKFPREDSSNGRKKAAMFSPTLTKMSSRIRNRPR